jgi:hypothetical protein
MDIVAATAAYERWVGERIPIVRADLRLKHTRMASGRLAFLRATYYRWCQLWLKLAGEAQGAVPVLSPGDLHVENYGTWRDGEGRLCWGINDFDEAAPLPWIQDLVRLVTSALFASDEGQLALRRRVAGEAVLTGYRDGLRAGGRPFVLEEDHGWLRRIAMSKPRDPDAFWARLTAMPPAGAVPATARKAINRAMPEGAGRIRFHRRVAGMGSLGRPRIVGIADCRGGKVAREVKAIVPSAWDWVRGRSAAGPPPYERMWRGAHRALDPMLAVNGGWVVRRLAPHATRIELADLPGERDEERLLHAMGFDAANVHLSHVKDAGRLRREVTDRGGDWLLAVVPEMTAAVESDWIKWRSAG